MLLCLLLHAAFTPAPDYLTFTSDAPLVDIVILGVYLVGAPLGAVALLASIPFLQWLVLRRWIRRAVFWIQANMPGWALGILWTLTPSPFIDERTPPWVTLSVFVTAGILMALTVATVTAFTARKVIRTSRLRENGYLHGTPPEAGV